MIFSNGINFIHIDTDCTGGIKLSIKNEVNNNKNLTIGYSLLPPYPIPVIVVAIHPFRVNFLDLDL